MLEFLKRGFEKKSGGVYQGSQVKVDRYND